METSLRPAFVYRTRISVANSRVLLGADRRPLAIAGGGRDAAGCACGRRGLLDQAVAEPCVRAGAGIAARSAWLTTSDASSLTPFGHATRSAAKQR